MPVTTLTVCPGRENNAWRKAETTGADHDLTPRYGEPVHCHRCAHDAHRQLAELPLLLAAVQMEATRGSSGPKVGTIGRIGGAVAAWPGQASRLMVDYIVGGLVELEDDIRDLRRLNTRPGRGTEGSVITGAVRFLEAHLDWALTHHPAAVEPHHRDGANPAGQIAAWHHAAERFTKRDTRLEHYRIPCPRCALLTLCRADGDDYIGCRNPACEVLLTGAEYLDHVRELAAAKIPATSGLAKISNAA